MKITKTQIEQLVREELSSNSLLNEELDSADFEVLRKFIRKEIAAIFFDLFKKRGTWV